MICQNQLPWHLGANLARIERASIARSVQHLMATQRDESNLKLLARFLAVAGIAKPRRMHPFNGRLTRLLITAVFRATGSPLLRGLCLRLLQAEHTPVPPPSIGTAREFWLRHRRAFRLAGFTWRAYAKAVLD